MSSSSSIQWFVEMGPGITLGPMPGDDLIELARSGSLLEQDKVRAGTTGPWHAAGDISNLFGENTSGDALAPPQSTDATSESLETEADDSPVAETREPHADDHPVDTTPELKARHTQSSLPQNSPQASKTPAKEPPLDRPKVVDAENTGRHNATSTDDADFELKPPAGQEPLENDPIPIAESLDEFDVSTDLPDPPNGSESCDSDELDFELNLPTPEKELNQSNLKSDSPDLMSESDQPKPDEPELPKAAVSFRTLDSEKNNVSPLPTDFAPADSTQIESRQLEPPARTVESSNAESSTSVPSLPHGFDVDPSSRRRMISSASSGSDFVKRVIQVSIAIGIAASLVTAITTLWPSGEPQIYSNYLTIYEKSRQYRNGDLDQSGWNEFATPAKSQLDETLLWLDENASADDRGKTLLLFAGQDLRDMLDHPPDSEYSHSDRLDGLLDQLDGIYSTSHD